MKAAELLTGLVGTGGLGVPMRVSASSVSIKEALLNFVFILVGAIAAISYLVPPAVVPASAPPTGFSAVRAIEHLKVIAREPHPTGSIANARVRDYLVEQLKLQGLEPRIQRTGISSLIDVFPGPYGAGTVENILARLKGSNSTGVVLLMAHYDSVSPAPGATDDGSGVVTLLEILSALRSGSPSRNDVVIVFTDGEELGTVGVGFRGRASVGEGDIRSFKPGFRWQLRPGFNRRNKAPPRMVGPRDRQSSSPPTHGFS